MELRPIVKGKDDRSFATKMQVTWYFDSWVSKAFLIIASFNLVYTIGKFLYNLIT